MYRVDQKSDTPFNYVHMMPHKTAKRQIFILFEQFTICY